MKTSLRHFTLLLLLLSSYIVSSQSSETLLYIKNDLIAQRKELQQKIDAIDIKLKDIDSKLQQSKGNYQQVKYLEKSNSSTTNKYQSSFQNKKTSSASRTYHRGSRGGCYYINSNGNKSYVARSMCN